MLVLGKVCVVIHWGPFGFYDNKDDDDYDDDDDDDDVLTYDIV